MSCGRLVSVNVGLPREIRWRGRAVRTAIFKAPVNARRRVTRTNVEGDAQADLAGHGGEQRAVFVYQLGSYAHWARELGRDDLRPGHFGENFTVDGLGDDEVCIGDRFAIGTALFEVTQPRVTCFKVGLRLDEPRMPALLVAHRRPGFYLRVLRAGEVGAGDAIEKVAAGPGRLSVSDASALLYLPGHEPDDLRRALSIPALSEGWRGRGAAAAGGARRRRHRVTPVLAMLEQLARQASPREVHCLPHLPAARPRVRPARRRPRAVRRPLRRGGAGRARPPARGHLPGQPRGGPGAAAGSAGPLSGCGRG